MKNKLLILAGFCALFMSQVFAPAMSTSYKLAVENFTGGTVNCSSSSYHLQYKTIGQQTEIPSAANYVFGMGFFKSAYFSKAVILAPIVVSITPNNAMAGGTVNITNLSGANFMQGAGVKLSKSGQANITSSIVTVESSTKITCVIDLAFAAAGLWDVTVKNPDGKEGSLPSAFTVSFASQTISITSPVVSTQNPYNPATGATSIKYTLSKDANITIYVYNMRGVRVWQTTLPAGSPGGQAGINEVPWNGITAYNSYVSSGVYFVTIVAVGTDGKPQTLGKTKIAVIK